MHIFIAALFTKAKKWKQWVSITEEQINKIMQTPNKILFGHKRESNLVLCGRNGIGGHYVKCSSLGKG